LPSRFRIQRPKQKQFHLPLYKTLPFSFPPITLCSFCSFIPSTNQTQGNTFPFSFRRQTNTENKSWPVLPRDIVSPMRMVGLLPRTLAFLGTTTPITTNTVLFLEHWVLALSTTEGSGAPLFFRQDLGDFMMPDSKITNRTFLKLVFFARSHSGIVTSSCTG